MGGSQPLEARKLCSQRFKNLSRGHQNCTIIWYISCATHQQSGDWQSTMLCHMSWRCDDQQCLVPNFRHFNAESIVNSSSPMKKVTLKSNYCTPWLNVVVGGDIKKCWSFAVSMQGMKLSSISEVTPCRMDNKMGLQGCKKYQRHI